MVSVVTHTRVATANIESKTQTINTKQFKTSYSYDAHDRMTSKIYPSQKDNRLYVYDSKGEFASMSIDATPLDTSRHVATKLGCVKDVRLI